MKEKFTVYALEQGNKNIWEPFDVKFTNTKENRYFVSMINPLKVKKFKVLNFRKAKNDNIDSK